jgi:hypothetical protein
MECPILQLALQCYPHNRPFSRLSDLQSSSPVLWPSLKSPCAAPASTICATSTSSIPRNALTVVTGLSGSGKSSLAFDTIYAEGQRRYVETLSAYARQFLDQIERPDVDSIEGLSAGHLHRAKDHQPQPPLDRRHHHRDLRLPAPALRLGRRAALPALRPADLPAIRRTDRRSAFSLSRRGERVTSDGARRSRTQGRIQGSARQARSAGLPRPRRWRNSRPL